MAVFVANTNMLELLGLKSAVDGVCINDADVTVTICNIDRKHVAGSQWPQTMSYVTGSAGNYSLLLDSHLKFEPNRDHYAYIDVNAGANRKGHWELTFRPVIRT